MHSPLAARGAARTALAVSALLAIGASACGDASVPGLAAPDVGPWVDGQAGADTPDAADAPEAPEAGSRPDVAPGADTGPSGADVAPEPGAPDRPADWTTETHSKDVPPNIAEVFSDTEVKRLDLVFSPDEWATMIDDMTAIYGEPGGFRGGPGGGPGGGGPGGGFSDQDPVFVPADVRYGGRTWPHVGVRFKGNSSLKFTWASGNLKLSFKLDFDEFEDAFPEIDDQRFYGMKKLSLKNNYADPSLAREKVMSDLFAEAGLAVSHAAFYEVYVDRGDGAEYFGLYTLVEELENSVLDSQFGGDEGNLYKPDGAAARFSEGSFDADEMGKKTHEDAADFSDVQALLAALHAPTRGSDPAAWRAGLDAVFDTDVFLRYLAVNGVAQNWDTYGRMTHNYYLYGDPATSKLTWIPWDNNEALQHGKMGGALPLDFAGLNAAQWPLIGFLYADPVYRAVYESDLADTVAGPFAVDAMHARYDAYEALLAPYAAAEREGFTFLTSPAAFATAFETLRAHAESRVATTQAYLAQ